MGKIPHPEESRRIAMLERERWWQHTLMDSIRGIEEIVVFHRGDNERLADELRYSLTKSRNYSIAIIKAIRMIRDMQAQGYDRVAISSLFED